MRIDTTQAYCHTVAIEYAAFSAVLLGVGMKFLFKIPDSSHAAVFRFIIVGVPFGMS